MIYIYRVNKSVAKWCRQQQVPSSHLMTGRSLVTQLLAKKALIVTWIMRITYSLVPLWNNCENESTVMKIGTDVANHIPIDISNGGKHYGNSNPWKNKKQFFTIAFTISDNLSNCLKNQNFKFIWGLSNFLIILKKAF